MQERIISFASGDHPIGGLRDTRQRPLRDLRISVMDRCNFRCPYCMPEDKYHKDFQFLRSSERLSFDEILRLAQIFGRMGVHKVRITGGEPLLRPGLADQYLTIADELQGVDPGEWTGKQVKRYVKPTARCLVEVY